MILKNYLLELLKFLFIGQIHSNNSLTKLQQLVKSTEIILTTQKVKETSSGPVHQKLTFECKGCLGVITMVIIAIIALLSALIAYFDK